MCFANILVSHKITIKIQKFISSSSLRPVGWGAWGGVGTLLLCDVLSAACQLASRESEKFWLLLWMDLLHHSSSIYYCDDSQLVSSNDDEVSCD